jgi:hypothetical protein
MAPKTLTIFVLTAALAAPAMADEAQRRRPREAGGQSQQAERPAGQGAARERAAPREAEQPRAQQQAPRAEQNTRVEQNSRVEQNTRQQQQSRGGQQARGGYAVPRQYDSRQYDNRQNNSRQYDNRQYDNRQNNSRQYDNRRYDGGRYDTRGNDSRRYGYTGRVIRPTIIRVAPYRPYVYRPSYGIGVYYGSDGNYPYGYTPRGYFDPIPGRYYGGVRITGAPRDAQVFADGYYVGIVNDFDGIFQHINLEAGPHHISIEMGGDEGIQFDVYVRPGETTTFRADVGYRPY